MNICSYTCTMKIKESRIDSPEFVTKVAQILKVIAHPVRLQVLAALRKSNPLNVSELSDMVTLEVEQSLLSHHLIKMRDNGILQCRKDGMYVYYSIVDNKIFNILDCMETCDLV